MRSFGNLIKNVRIKKGYSLRKMEELTGISFSHLSKIERGEYKPTTETVIKLADALGLDRNGLMLTAGYFPSSDVLPGKATFEEVYKDLIAQLKDLGLVKQRDNNDCSENGEGLAQYSYEGDHNGDLYIGEETFSNLVQVPIVGVVKAGFNGLAYDDPQGFEPTSKDDVAGGEYMWLRVKGDSMIGDGILPGDLALVRIQPEVESGDLAVVIINGYEGTLKRVFINGGAIILQASNPSYPPKYFKGEELKNIRIVGKVKQVRRNF